MPTISGLKRQVQRFLDHLEVERGLSPNTLAAYGADLHRFSRAMIDRHGEGVGPADVVERDVLAYLEALAKARMAAFSQTRHLTAVRFLFRHPQRSRGTQDRSDRVD